MELLSIKISLLREWGLRLSLALLQNIQMHFNTVPAWLQTQAATERDNPALHTYPTAFQASDLTGMQLQDTSVQHANQTVLLCLPHSESKTKIGNQQDSPFQRQPAGTPNQFYQTIRHSNSYSPFPTPNSCFHMDKGGEKVLPLQQRKYLLSPSHQLI